MEDTFGITLDLFMTVIQAAFMAGAMACATPQCDTDAAWAESLTKHNAEVYATHKLKWQRKPTTLRELAADIERQMAEQGISQ